MPIAAAVIGYCLVKSALAERGESFVEYFLRLSRETDGRALFNYRLFCQDMDELGDLFRHSSHVLPSLGDAWQLEANVKDAVKAAVKEVVQEAVESAMEDRKEKDAAWCSSRL